VNMNGDDALIRAAEKLERILDRCTPGPWRRFGYGSYGPTVSADLRGLPYDDDAFGVETSDSDRGRADAEYLETMNPSVAGLLVELLRRLHSDGDPRLLAVAFAHSILDQHEYEGPRS
jgi:hypothetical protein